jgi:hypothetical protein
MDLRVYKTNFEKKISETSIMNIICGGINDLEPKQLKKKNPIVMFYMIIPSCFTEENGGLMSYVLQLLFR